MNTTIVGKPPAWYRILAIVGLLWTLLGAYSYLIHVGAVPGPEMTEAEQSLADRTPFWVTSAYAIAVFAGAVGALGLVLLKSWARPLLILSLVAVLIQEVWVLFLSGATDVHGTSAIILPLVVIAVALLLVWMANTGLKRGWLT